jgi:coenzyme F420 hydrogenase subunit beta
LIRENSGSGGVISALLIHLLEEERLDGAVVVRMNKEKPWLPEIAIARSREEVLDAAQSKYAIVPVNTVLRDIGEGSYVFVGLPCHVHGLRKAMMVDKKLSKRIKYIIGNYCGLNMEYDATKAVIDKFGIDFKDIKKFEYRGGKWPGGMKITLIDDSTLFLPKFHSNYLTPMYYAKRCLLCIDLSNELADISVGDGWVMESKGEGGWSIIIGRTERGASLLQKAEKKSIISLDEISYDDATMSHSHGLDMKKRGAFIRIQNRKKKGKAFPRYGFKIPEATLKRRIDEHMFSFYMWFNSLSVTRWIINKIPFSVLGFYYVRLRGFWKKTAHYN